MALDLLTYTSGYGLGLGLESWLVMMFVAGGLQVLAAVALQ